MTQFCCCCCFCFRSCCCSFGRLMQARFSWDLLWLENIGDVQRDPITHICSAYRWFLLKWNLSSSISFYLNCWQIYVKFINHRSHKSSISSGVDHFPTSQEGAPLTVGSRLHFVFKSISVLGHSLLEPFGTITGTFERPNALCVLCSILIPLGCRSSDIS